MVFEIYGDKMRKTRGMLAVKKNYLERSESRWKKKPKKNGFGNRSTTLNTERWHGGGGGGKRFGNVYSNVGFKQLTPLPRPLPYFFFGTLVIETHVHRSSSVGGSVGSSAPPETLFIRTRRCTYACLTCIITRRPRTPFASARCTRRSNL